MADGTQNLGIQKNQVSGHFTTCVIVGRSFIFSEPQFTPVSNWDNIPWTTYFLGLL